MLTRPLYQVEGGEDEEESEAELFKRMIQIVEEEKEINQATMAELSGSAVKYGTVIHLQHVKTGLYVATQAKMIAEHERSCSAVMLQEKISSGCFFKVESRLVVSRLACTSLHQPLFVTPISLLSLYTLALARCSCFFCFTQAD